LKFYCADSAQGIISKNAKLMDKGDRGQGYVIYVFILGPFLIYGTAEASAFKFGVQVNEE